MPSTSLPTRRRVPSKAWHAAFVLALAPVAMPAFAADGPGVEFFEKRVRPVLIEQCYQCHNSHDKTEGGLALDYRDGLTEGGDSGPAVVPGRPEESLLIKAVRHGGGVSKMPKGNPKLSDAAIADLAKWVELGAPDPRDEPPTAKELAALNSWDAVREQRKRWWSFQPVVRPTPPEVRRKDWSDHPVDRFILAQLEKEGLEPAGVADRGTLIRRVTFALTGLPPSPEEIERFLRDESPRAYEDLVDRLLQSPRFGERWARHWMDWFRYADSHGSEGDPTIPHAWRYRDYLIRALNADVPYPQLVREHLAGDLLPKPRVDRTLGINESALGTAHLRMVPHGYAPTDALDEQVTFTDNQIDVLSKAFLGLTVSCARCHNHKFDPISQADFYALYGVLASSRPALITVDTPERADTNRTALERLKGQIRAALAGSWAKAVDGLAQKLNDPDAFNASTRDEAAKDPGHPLHAWAALRGRQGEAFAQAWDKLRADAKSSQSGPTSPLCWDLTGGDYAAWFKHGSGLPEKPAAPGEFHVTAAGDQVVSNVYPAGVYTHRLSTKHNGVLTSPRFKIETDEVSVRVAGGNGARTRLVVQNYPRVPGLIYQAFEPNGETFRWQRWDTRYWKGEWAYLEVTTGEDIPVEVRPNNGRSWFGITAAAGHAAGQTAGPGPKLPATFWNGQPASTAELAALYAATLREAVAAWAEGAMTDEQAEFLGWFVRNRELPNTLAALPEAAPLVAEYRRLEGEIPVPTRAPGVLEGTSFDQPLFVRGNHKKPAYGVPRRFLEVFGSAPYRPQGSGRKELAESLADLRNPLVSRVIVNRLWHHLFGRGIVATTDNFGRMGDQPTHPELLDELTTRFVEGGGAIKPLIRLIVTSKTYRLGTRAPAGAAERDPTNLSLSHFPVRRLEAEALRDAILAVSGRLDEQRFGPEVDGRSRRRSVYVRVRRNELDPFLNTFDAPEPSSTRGRRDTTNVPAQSLTLLNDPWVREQARHWANAIVRDESLSDDERIRSMFLTALGRLPTDGERDQCRRFLAEQDRQHDLVRREIDRLESAVASKKARIDALTEPTRVRLAGGNDTRVRRGQTPEPIARWEFDGDLRDAVGALHGTKEGAPALNGGALVLDGKSFVRTEPLPRPLAEKTLEAWVVLDDADQRGGGVMSVESVDGQVFDAIVFGEMSPREWLAGSDNFRRTVSFQAPPDDEAAARPVHVAIVYRSDGTITGYRDGKPYGKSYRSSGLLRFEPGQSHVVFGLRHSPAGGNKMLKGKVLRAGLYDRALNDGEVVRLSEDAPAGSVPEAAVLAALSEADRAEVGRLKAEIEVASAELRRRENEGGRPDPARRWQDLAHSVMNLKEFLYVR